MDNKKKGKKVGCLVDEDYFGPIDLGYFDNDNKPHFDINSECRIPMIKQKNNRDVIPSAESEYRVYDFFNDLKTNVLKLLRLKSDDPEFNLNDEVLSLIITNQESKNHIRAVKAWARGNPKYVLSLEQLDTYIKNLRNYLNNLEITDDDYKSIQSVFDKYKERNTLKQTRWEKRTSDNGEDSDYSVVDLFNDLNKNTQHIIRRKTCNSNLYLSFKKLSTIIDNNTEKDISNRLRIGLEVTQNIPYRLKC